ncbi:MAG: hypothetical protein JWO82_2223 [Akkermansiaceae bacterium]|nr:hypothetical protein [Akkermansiaceae bacterium]
MKFSIIILTALSGGLSLGESKLDLPPEIADKFQQKHLVDDGSGDINKRISPELTQYVLSHWRELLENFETIHTRADTSASSITTLGLVAEALPPEDYVDFMDRYVEIYAQGRIPERALVSQLRGVGRKSLFMAVNARHPKVLAVLNKAKGAVPVENLELQKIITDEMNGKGVDGYYFDAVQGTPSPETMPGIHLKPPFGSSTTALGTRGIRHSITNDAAGDGTGLPAQSSIGASTLLAAFKARPGKYGVMLLSLALLLVALFRVLKWRLFRRRANL